jgi:hypothetical protein
MVLLMSFSFCAADGQTPPAPLDVPADFPRFIVPAHEKEMASLRALFWLHDESAGPLIPLWDAWMPMSTLWPARGTALAELQFMRGRWASALASRGIDAEGYVVTQQHDGPAHAEGWPFPRWMDAGGIGWHFRGTGVAGYDAPLVTPDDWKLTGAKDSGVNDKGWAIDLTEARATAQSPAFAIDAKTSPWLRLNWWARGLESANGYVEWTTRDQPDFSPQRRAYFSPAVADPQHTFMAAGGGGSGAGKIDTSARETRTMIPVYRIPGWSGTITGLRLHFENLAPAKIVIKSFHTACDTRHNINNLNFIRGVHDYFMWTGDYNFLRDQIGRVRVAMAFVMQEFDTRRRKCIYTTWAGHEGRSGVRWSNGKKQIVKGEGIGSNYWDLLPFGGEDALATVYYYDTLQDLAELEEQIATHPQWCIPTRSAANAPGPVQSAPGAFDSADLRAHAQEVKDYGTKRFWNDKTGRFGTRDLDGNLHDYGFTFLNNEAVYYDFATPQQAKSIHAWLAGERTVEGDTSTGTDIYHWRFGPRSTTRRNIDYYYWGWSSPESIPFGHQVQDGGAVLGFSFHDLMMRLKTAGPNDAAARLREIVTWFDDTQAAGGYRAYYKDPARGTMQGANVAGGLGIDKEFFESILVPQVMLYGFLGLRPTADGFSIDPRLPDDWPELTITRIHLHQHVLDLTATRDAVTISGSGPSDVTLVVHAPPRLKISPSAGVSVKVEPLTERPR